MKKIIFIYLIFVSFSIHGQTNYTASSGMDGNADVDWVLNGGLFNFLTSPYGVGNNAKFTVEGAYFQSGIANGGSILLSPGKVNNSMVKISLLDDINNQFIVQMDGQENGYIKFNHYGLTFFSTSGTYLKGDVWAQNYFNANQLSVAGNITLNGDIKRQDSNALKFANANGYLNINPTAGTGGSIAFSSDRFNYTFDKPVVFNGGIAVTDATNLNTLYVINGKVGIGVVPNAEKLEVSGNMKLTGELKTGSNSQLTIRNNYGYVTLAPTSANYCYFSTDRPRFLFSKEVMLANGILGAQGTGSLKLQTNTTSRLTILSTSGYVGIGTETPTERLDVNGSAYFGTGTVSKAYVRGNSTFSTATTPDYTWYGNDQTGIYHPATNQIGFSIAGQEKMKLNENGDLGIGISNPTVKLDVAGSAYFGTGLNSKAYIRGNNGFSTATTPDYTWWGNDQTGIYHPATNQIGFSIAGQEKMKLNENGNLGIGVSPGSTYKLEVAGTFKATGISGVTLNLTGALTGSVFSNPTGAIEINTASNNRINVANDGQIIFRNGPATTNKVVFNYDGGADNDEIHPIEITSVTVANENDMPQVLKMGVDPVNRCSYIQSAIKWRDRDALCLNPKDGIVTIGIVNYDWAHTNRKNYALAVGGKVIATEVIVQLQEEWPDYVFENNYKMKTLAEVENFIQANKHLPGVPSAAEVKENGVSVGEMNAVLLKKIEELTLYMIEIKKENEVMKQENIKTQEVLKTLMNK